MLKEKTAKGADVVYDLHSTQINLYDCASEKDFNFILLQKEIPECCIYREYPQIEKEIFLSIFQKDDPREEYGLENVPHISVLYGIKKEDDYFDMRDKLKNFGKIEFEIGKIKSFRNVDKPYDVIVLEIISPKLNELHNFLKEKYDNAFSFPTYTPHMTIAYVQKDKLKEIEGDCAWTGAKYSCNIVRFSHINGYFLDIPLE